MTLTNHSTYIYLDTVLGGFGLLFPHSAQHGHQTHVHEKDIFPPYAELKLTECLQKHHALNVTHCATHLLGID